MCVACFLCISRKTEKTVEAVETTVKHICETVVKFTYFNRELKVDCFELALKFGTFALSI